MNPFPYGERSSIDTVIPSDEVGHLSVKLLVADEQMIEEGKLINKDRKAFLGSKEIPEHLSKRVATLSFRSDKIPSGNINIFEFDDDRIAFINRGIDVVGRVYSYNESCQIANTLKPFLDAQLEEKAPTVYGHRTSGACYSVVDMREKQTT
ncbi:MAG: hypothetical protein ABIC57_02400 [bacterium]